MTKQLSDQGGSKPWFWPALLGILAAGVVIFYVAGQANGPRKPLVDPVSVERNKVQYEQVMALLDQGLKLLEAGRFSEAMPLAEQALALRGDLVITHMAVAQIALQMREYDRAEKEFLAVLQKQPDDVEARLSLGVIAAVRKDYEDARRKVAAVLSDVDPSWTRQSIPLTVLQTAANMDQPEVAAQHARTAAQLGDGKMSVIEARMYGPDVVALLAEQFEQLNRPIEAGITYAEAASLTPGNLVKAQRAGRAAEMLLAGGKLEQAAEQARTAIEADPSNPQWVVLRDRIAAATSQPNTGELPSIDVTPFGLAPN